CLRVYNDECRPEESVLREVIAHDCDIISLAFSRELGLIATGDCKGTARIWDFQRLRLECQCHFQNTQEITALTFLSPWPLLVVSGSQGGVALVDINDCGANRCTLIAKAIMPSTS